VGQDRGTSLAPQQDVDARQRWQALQARLTAARTSFEAGNREQALAEVTAALELDPNFLAAVALRDRIVSGEPGIQHPELRTQNPAPATRNPEPGKRPLVDTAGYAKFEQRARRRRVDRRLDAARAAIAKKKLREAASALDEVIELDPNLPELSELTAAFDDLRKNARRSRLGPALAAAAAFGGILFGATWLHEGQVLLSHPMTAVAPLVEAYTPEPIAATPVDDAQPVATTGERENRGEVMLPPVERPRVTSVAVPVTEPEPARIANPEPRTPIVAQPPVQQESRAVIPPSVPQPSTPLTAPIVTPTANVVSVPAPIVPAVANEEAQIKQALQRYRSAYEGLDARLARTVYPAVNEAALARAFDSLESQSLTFDACDVELHGEGATAFCRGSARYVPKIGSREPRTEPRNWTFALRKNGTDWKIESARAER